MIELEYWAAFSALSLRSPSTCTQGTTRTDTWPMCSARYTVQSQREARLRHRTPALADSVVFGWTFTTEEFAIAHDIVRLEAA